MRLCGAILALVLPLLVGCGGKTVVTNPDPLPPFDQAGYRYPAACMVDLTPMLANGDITVERPPQAEIQRKGDAVHIFGRNRRGIAMLRRTGEAGGRPHYLISIAAELGDWQYRDSLRHELCHIVAGPDWHGIPD